MPGQVSGFPECLNMILDGIPITFSRSRGLSYCQPPPLSTDFQQLLRQFDIYRRLTT